MGVYIECKTDTMHTTMRNRYCLLPSDKKCVIKGEKKMNKKITLLTMAIIIVAMLVPLFKPAQATNGSRNSFDFVWYPSGVGTAFAALRAGTIDILDWPLNITQKLIAESDSNLQLVNYSSNSLWELDLNNNKTIATYGGTATSATAIPEVRKAIACLIDKDVDVIAGILHYYGIRIDAPVAASQTSGWVDPSNVGVNYPYKMSVANAIDYLASAGFWGDGTWLHYPNNTAVWGTSAGKTTDPNTPGGQPLVVVIRNTDPLRLALGILIEARLDGNGFPPASVLYGHPRWAYWGLQGGAFGTTGTTCAGPKSYTSSKVMGYRDYNIYTGGWTVGRYPIYCFSLFHTSFWYSFGENYVTGDTWATGNPDYATQMDPLLEGIMYATSVANSQASCRSFTKYFIDNCVCIMLWSTASFNAWRKNVVGVVNEQGYGIINDFTFMNAYKTGAGAGTPLIVGEPETWTLMNPLYSQYIFEQHYLSRIVGQTMTVNPYDISVDQPWMAQDWSVGTWFDDRTNMTKTAVTYWFRKDCGCAAPVTGTFAGFFNSEDYAANMWYTYVCSDCWWSDNTMNINHISIDDNYKATVYFDDYSIWFVYEPTYPIMMPKNVLTSNTELCGVREDMFLGSDLTTPAGALPGYLEYAFTGNSVVEVINATCNGALIYEGVDFYIRAGYNTWTRNVFVPLRAFAPGDVITIAYYYALPGAAGGTFLGISLIGSTGVPYTLYSYSYLYPISLSATSSSLVSNPFFFLPVPLLGEINWIWNWVGTTKPRSGYYRIDILDVVRCTSSYCHRGDGTYDPTYFPGADLDASDLCHVGILDLVSITGKYFQTFGQPIDGFALGANDVGAAGSATATFPGLPALGAPTFIFNLIWAQAGPLLTATLGAAAPWGFAFWRGQGIVILDRNPVWIRLGLTYEVLIAVQWPVRAASASTTWTDLVGGTWWANVPINEAVTFAPWGPSPPLPVPPPRPGCTGAVTATPAGGPPSFAFGRFTTSPATGAVPEWYFISVT
jgi:hypothetical protein